MLGEGLGGQEVEAGTGRAQAGLWCAAQEEGLALPASCRPGASTPFSFHINKTFNRFLANWQEKYM